MEKPQRKGEFLRVAKRQRVREVERESLFEREAEIGEPWKPSWAEPSV